MRPPSQPMTSWSSPAQVADEKGVVAEGLVAAEGDHALIVARFADTQSAIAIYDRLLAAEIDGSLHIDGVLVAKGDRGRARSTSRR